jgi:hypothetical protein
MAKFPKKVSVSSVSSVSSIEEVVSSVEEAIVSDPVVEEAVAVVSEEAVSTPATTTTKFNFQKALEAMELTSYKHRKVTATGKEITMIKIPSLLIAALSGVEFVSVPGHSAKQQFEKFVLDTVAPGKSSNMTNEEITKMVSHTTDAWFPKDLGEYQTHPIQREIADTSKGKRPVRYFLEEVLNTEEGIGGTRCAPRPVGTGTANKEAAALKASAALMEDETVKAALLAKAESLENPVVRNNVRNPNSKEIKALELAASVMGEGEAKVAILAKIAALS